ncbi:hypothetical protein [Hydrogenophaga aquatica]
MRIPSTSSVAFQRETPKATGQNRAERNEAQTPTEKPAKTAPPGLEKVLARLEAMGESRTQGQGVAMDRISRNLARYAENQALAPAPAPAPVEDTAPEVTPPVAEAPAEAPAPATPENTDNVAELIDSLNEPADDGSTAANT